MWVIIILFCATFVLQVIFNVLVTIPYEDLGEDPWSWTHFIPPWLENMCGIC